MKRLAVVTGCAGFIGLNLVEKLLKNKWHVYGIDKLTYAANTKQLGQLEKTYKHTFTFVKQDIATLNWLPDCDVLFNLAAESDVDNSNNNCAQFVQTNIQGVQNLLSLLNNKSIRTQTPLFFQFSTDEVYGDIQTGSFSESTALKPNNPYAATKAAADMLIQTWARSHDLNYVIVRPSNNYGKFQYPEKLIPLAVKTVSRAHKIKLHNNGDPIRTWTHVQDTISAVLEIYHNGDINTVYNISSGYECSNKHVVSIVLKSMIDKNCDIENFIDYRYNRKGQDVRYSISCNPLLALGWSPSYIFEVELPKLVTHYFTEKLVW